MIRSPFRRVFGGYLTEGSAYEPEHAVSKRTTRGAPLSWTDARRERPPVPEWRLVSPERPLVVDLDGSLLRVDTLHESIISNARHPRTLLKAGIALLRHGKAGMKRALASESRVNVDLLPTNPAVVELMELHAASGGRVVLATGADSAIAHGVAARFPAITEVMASDGVTNLTSESKARALVASFGEYGFDYVGNSRADVAVWRHAEKSYLARASASATLPRWSPLPLEAVLADSRPKQSGLWLRQVRVHQSLKNILLFLPVLAAHELTDPDILGRALLGFITFTLMAFSVYLLNDLLDVDADRLHPRKKHRPIAAGWVDPLTAALVGVVCATVSVTLAFAIDPLFASVLVAYAVLTIAYSFWLKRITLVDVVTLAMLYMIRIVAGAVVAGIALSFWFTGVTLFLFLSLALAKRYAELLTTSRGEKGIPGRAYTRDDIGAILALGVASGLGATLLMAIYIQSDAVDRLYPASTVLWLIIPTMFFWIANLWITAGRGKMNDDPVIFALRDRASLISGAILIVLFFVASLPEAADLINRLGIS